MSAPAVLQLSAVELVLGGRPILRGVDLEVRAGERVALVGPSGAGKTSLLRLCNASLRPRSGSVRVNGVALERASERELARLRARVGFVHQDLALVPQLRVVQNVLCGALGGRGSLSALRALYWPSRQALEQVHALLERLGIEESMYRRTDTLSGGEQQRVAVARALHQEPLALLADEPVAAVDPARARAVLELFDELARERGLALLVSLHDVELARALFPRVIGLRAGRVQFDLAADALDDERLRALYALEAADA